MDTNAKIASILAGATMLVGGGQALPEQSINDSVEGKSYEERTEIKSDAIVEKDIVSLYHSDEHDIDVSIVSLEKVPNGIKIYAKAWHEGRPVQFISGETEDFTIINPPVLVDDSDGEIVINSTDMKGNPKTRTLKEDPEAAIKEVLARAIAKQL